MEDDDRLDSLAEQALQELWEACKGDIPWEDARESERPEGEPAIPADAYLEILDADDDDFPVVCGNGCPEGHLGRHKFSCSKAGMTFQPDSGSIPWDKWKGYRADEE